MGLQDVTRLASQVACLFLALVGLLLDQHTEAMIWTAAAVVIGAQGPHDTDRLT